MEITFAPQYQFTLTSQEFRLISKALRGVALLPEEAQAAAALQVKMVKLRAAQARSFLAAVQKDADNAEEK